MPDLLDPELPADPYTGFGRLREQAARQEGEVALRALFARFPGLALVDEEPDWMPRPGMRRPATLRVTLGLGNP